MKIKIKLIDNTYDKTYELKHDMKFYEIRELIFKKLLNCNDIYILNKITKREIKIDENTYILDDETNDYLINYYNIKFWLLKKELNCNKEEWKTATPSRMRRKDNTEIKNMKKYDNKIIEMDLHHPECGGKSKNCETSKIQIDDNTDLLNDKKYRSNNLRKVAVLCRV